jgi:hypothetical protein
MSNCEVITSPIRFLGATVLSFNTTLGMGFSESTLNVDLIEDCANNDDFEPFNGSKKVGDPVYFTAGGFNFGGVLTNWTITQGNSGETFNVQVSDPRQLLENTIVIVDTYAGSEIAGPNYFNVYAGYESEVLQGNCNAYGSSKSGERGMPYSQIIAKLGPAPVIFSPTGHPYIINISSFPQGVPEYYRVPGPGISMLQLLQDVCDVLGFEFYVDLYPGGIINIGLIDLKNEQSGNFLNILNAFDGSATELSYGQELRNEKTKALIFGEKQHYLTYVNQFDYFFGEDVIGDELVPITPVGYDSSGFWIYKKIDTLNAGLFTPLASNGPFAISELDIRAAMSSYELWSTLALDSNSGGQGTLNYAIRNAFGDCVNNISQAIDDAMGNNNNLDPAAKWKRMHDMVNNTTKSGAETNKPNFMTDLQAIHSFVQNLGSTYYGKQFISTLGERICVYQGENFQEKVFSSVPTNDGGWIEDGISVLGLGEPELTSFRSDDNRIGPFAVFNSDGDGKGIEQ